MNILETLRNSKEQIYLDDLIFFETELATGDYDKKYIDECTKEIAILKKWLSEKNHDKAKKVNQIKQDISEQKDSFLVKRIHDIAPKSLNPTANNMSVEDTIFYDIKEMREIGNYKSMFKAYIQDKKEIDSNFIDKHFSFFKSWEIDTILSIKQMNEEFLEKYFNTLDKDIISRYQCFSESFFMKHYSQLDPMVVLKKGKNTWQKKEERSKQLDVFLRLKGVKI